MQMTYKDCKMTCSTKIVLAEDIIPQNFVMEQDLKYCLTVHLSFNIFSFPVNCAFCDTSKDQGQSLKEVGIDLREECFSMWLVESWFCKSLTYSGTPMEKRNKCGL
jgi:hypothetical protein